jgi:hypothetical protein
MKFIAVIIFTSIFISACGGYRSEVKQGTESSFIKFKTEIKDFSFTVDEGDLIFNNPDVEQYEIKPGTHIVKVYRGDRLVVNRKVFIDNQTVFEIEVP